MRIGLFGGTFNPIHNGHLQIAEEVHEKLNLDRVIFIPSGIPPHKDQKIPSAAHRLEMARLAILDKPHFQLCDIEVTRPGKSYSVDTVSRLKSLYPSDSLFFIIGMDAFHEIPTWREADRLITLCNFAVVSRPGHPFSRYPKFGPLREIDPAPLIELDRHERNLFILPASPETAFYFVDIPPSPVSASEIRKEGIAQKPAKKLLPEPVESYIIKNNLYKTP